MAEQRIVILTGHYGSGKTSLAVAIALDKRRRGRRVAVGDLDIVNPYFRTADCRALLAGHGIEVIASPFAGSNVDLPALPKALYALAEDAEMDAVLDVGGDDRGAVALARYAPALLGQRDYALLFVANFYRPLTRTAADAAAVLREIEAACGMRATALVNNSNLGRETRAADVLASLAEAELLSALVQLPIAYTSVDARLLPALAGQVENPYPIAPQSMPAAK